MWRVCVWVLIVWVLNMGCGLLIVVGQVTCVHFRPICVQQWVYYLRERNLNIKYDNVFFRFEQHPLRQTSLRLSAVYESKPIRKFESAKQISLDSLTILKLLLRTIELIICDALIYIAHRRCFACIWPGQRERAKGAKQQLLHRVYFNISVTVRRVECLVDFHIHQEIMRNKCWNRFHNHVCVQIEIWTDRGWIL